MERDLSQSDTKAQAMQDDQEKLARQEAALKQQLAAIRSQLEEQREKQRRQSHPAGTSQRLGFWPMTANA